MKLPLLAVFSFSAALLAHAAPPRIHLKHAGLPMLRNYQNSPSPELVRLTKIPTIAVSATQGNALVASEVRSGAVAWRLALQDDDPILQFVTHRISESLILMSGHGGAILRRISLQSGRVLWETHQHRHIEGFVPDAAFHAADAVFLRTGDLLTLANGRTIRKVDGKTGEVLWRHDFETSNVMRARLIAPTSDDEDAPVRVLALDPGTDSSFRAHVDLLDSSTGVLLSSTSAAAHPLRSIVDLVLLYLPSLSNPTASPTSLVAWITPTGQLVGGPIAEKPSGKLVTKPASLKQGVVSIEDVGLAEHGYLLARSSDGAAVALEIGTDGSFAQRWIFPEQDPNAIFSSDVDRHGQLHIGRLSYSPVLDLASHAVATMPCKEYEEGIVTGETFPYNRDLHGAFTSALIEVSERKNFVAVSRILVHSASGSASLWLGAQPQWDRADDLSDIVAVIRASRDAEDPAAAALEFGKVNGISDGLRELRDAWLNGRLDAKRLPSLLGLSTTDAVAPTALLPPAWYVGTSTGRLHALAGPERGGRTMWSVNLLSGAEGGRTEQVQWRSLKEEFGSSVTALIEREGSAMSVTVDGKDGKIVSKAKAEVVDTIQLSKDRTTPGLTFIHHDGDVGASPARVAGDRSLQLKYLDPNITITVTCLPASSLAHIEAFDPLRGDRLDAFDVDGGCDGSGRSLAQVGLTSNLIVVAAPSKSTDEGRSDGAKAGRGAGTVLHSREWFLRNQTDVKLSAIAPGKAQAVSKTFLLPFSIKQLIHARTRLGISSRALVAITDDNRVVMIPRRLLDPHRPTGKPNKAEVEEGLIPLTTPLIDLGIDSYLTGPAQILTLQHIATFPTAYESASSVFATGPLDTFIRDIYPSGRAFDMLGDDFNRTGLALTILGLLVAVLVMRPIVHSRKLKAEWYS